MRDDLPSPHEMILSLLRERISLAEKLLLNETSLRSYARHENSEKINEILHEDSLLISAIDILSEKIQDSESSLNEVQGDGDPPRDPSRVNRGREKIFIKEYSESKKKYITIMDQLRRERAALNLDLDRRLEVLKKDCLELESISKIKKLMRGGLPE